MAAVDFTDLIGSVEQGYAAGHLSLNSAPSWKSRPLLLFKPCRTTSALIGKFYMAAGQAGATLHTMAILQAYQAEVLKELDEGDGVTPEAVRELRRATDLALCVTKHTARAVGRSMAGLVTAERHLWLNLTENREKEKATLLMPSSINSGLLKCSQQKIWESVWQRWSSLHHLRKDLLCQLQGRIWHPRPEIWKLWVWQIIGRP